MASVGELGSRSDLETLRRSGRGKIVIAGLLLTGALAAASWSFTRKSGTGNPEDASKVLVVTRGQSVGYKVVLNDLGFDSAEGTLTAWERKAEDEVPDLEGTGVSAVMELADRFGFGFVVFEGPHDVDFSALDIEGGVPELGEHVRFAVVSAGDFAFPHVMKVNPPPSPVMRDPSLSLLRALFEHERLGELKPDNENPSVEVIRLRDRLQGAISRLERIPEAESMAAGIVKRAQGMLVDQERADPKPQLLGDPLESVGPVPLADGSLLTISRRFTIVSSDGVRADLDLDKRERLLHYPPGAAPSGERQSCASLLGGGLDSVESPRYEFAVAGDAVLFKTLSEGLSLWTLSPAAEGTSCNFTKAGAIPPAAPGVAPLGVPHKSGLVARAGVADGFGVVSVVQAGTDGRQMLGMIEGVELASPTWLDGRHIVARGARHDGESDALYLLSLDAPLTVLELESAAFENATRVAQFAAVPRGAAARDRLVVSAGRNPRKLYQLELPATVSELFANPPSIDDGSDDDGSEREQLQGMPKVVRLDSNSFTVTPLTHEGRARDPVVSPDGRFVAFGLSGAELDRPDEDGDPEVAIVRLDAGAAGGGMRLLSRNALKDHSPRFTHDSAWVVFKTRFEIPRTDWVITAARMSKTE